MALTKVTYSMIKGAAANILDFGAVPDGVTDSTAAIQAAHDSLPATGGTIYIPDGNFCLAVDNSYVELTKPNVTVIGSNGGFISSPGSADPEVTSGTRYLNGIKIYGNNNVISVNMRGPSLSWYPGTALDILTVRDMKMYNIYVGGIYIQGTLAFDTLRVENVTFEYARDLASDPGNYEMIQRSSASTDPIGKLVVVSNCLFRGIAGGVDAHNVENVVICNGTRFEGCDILCIKLATANNGYVAQNLTVDETVTFDGASVNPSSANRHIACTGLGRATPNAGLYMGFIQIFNNVQFHGKVSNYYNNTGLAFLDGSYIDAVINLDRSVWVNCFNGVENAQGTISMCDMKLTASNIYTTLACIMRSLNFQRNRMINSWAGFTTRCVAGGDKYVIAYNNVDYSANNFGAIRLYNHGADNEPSVVCDNNVINVTGSGNTNGIVSPVSGTQVLIGSNNVFGTGVTNSGQYFTTYQFATGTYTGGLPLPLKNGEITVVNTNATGTIVYVLTDAVSSYLPIGTIFKAVRTSAAQTMTFFCPSGIGGYSTAALTSQYDSISLEKVASDKWAVVSTYGTVVFS